MPFCNPTALVFGFMTGLLITSILNDKPDIIIKHPTPYNTKNITYFNSNGNCYQYQANQIICPKNNKVVHNLPVYI